MNNRSTPHKEPTPRHNASQPTEHTAHARATALAQHASASRHSSPRPRRRGNKAPAIIALVVMLAIVGGGIALWANRTVSVTVNGTRTDVRADATLEQIISSEEVSVTPGDLVSVGGNVITEGAGEPFAAAVNGRALEENQISEFRAQGNEDIVFSDGADITEASHEEERAVQPKLEPYESIGAVTFVEQWGYAGRQMFTVGDVSGEAVAGEVIEPVQNVVLRSLNPAPDDGSKVIALTFDDGPSSYTQRYLDILDEYGIHATFFCLGTAASANPDLVKAIEEQGSQVASHTNAHQQLTTLDASGVQSEITDAFSAIVAGGASPTTVIRPPYGDFTPQTWLDAGGTLSTSVIWNLDSEDWRIPGTNAIVSNCTNGAYSGAIILMHDGGGNRDQDLKALPKIIEKLQKRGYTFVTVSELMAMDSRIPAEVAAGDATMPEDSVWPTELAE